MRNKLIYAIILALLAFSFAGCSKDSEMMDLTKDLVLFETEPKCIYQFDWEWKAGKEGPWEEENNVWNRCCSAPSIVGLANDGREYVGSGLSRYERWYNCSISTLTVNSQASLDFIGKGLCKYSVKWIPKNAEVIFTYECVFSSKDNDEMVGKYGSEHLKTHQATIETRSFNVLKTDDRNQYILYEGDTYIDAYIEGETIHLIQRVPSVKDMGTFDLKK